MKKIAYTLIMVWVAATMLQAEGGDPVKKLYRKFKKQDQVFNIVLPGILVRTCVGMARPFIHDPEAKAGLKIARKIRGIRVLSDEGNNITEADAKHLISQLRKNRKLEPLLITCDKGAQTWIMGNVKRNRLKRLVVVTYNEDGFTMVSVRSRLKMKHVNDLIRKLNKKMKKENRKPIEAPPVA